MLAFFGIFRIMLLLKRIDRNDKFSIYESFTTHLTRSIKRFQLFSDIVANQLILMI